MVCRFQFTGPIISFSMCLRISLIVKCMLLMGVLGNPVKRNANGRSMGTEDDGMRHDEIGNAENTAVGTLVNAIAEIPALEAPLGNRFRVPCKGMDRCNRSMRRLMVPKLTQLENTIMGVMKDLASMPPGARLPDKLSKTDPWLLMMDGTYKEPMCMLDAETCAQEDRRRLRILKKLFLKKYSNMRQQLIGYGGRRLWGGEANLFYR